MKVNYRKKRREVGIQWRERKKEKGKENNVRKQN